MENGSIKTKKTKKTHLTVCCSSGWVFVSLFFFLFYSVDAERSERSWCAASCSSENSSSPPVWNHLPTLYWSRLVVVVTQVRLTVSDKRLNVLQRTGNNLQSSSNWATLVQSVKVCGGAFARMCLQMTGTDCWLSVWICDIYRSLIDIWFPQSGRFVCRSSESMKGRPMKFKRFDG